MSFTLLGFNGERNDLYSGHLHPGQGYREYNTVLKCFHSPDSWSPFGTGGINAYAYCSNDPVNRADVTGHMSWQGITGMTLGLAGLLLIPFTLGQSATVTTCVMAALDVISGVTAVASAAFEKTNPTLSGILGWCSLATGVLSLGAGGFRGLTGMRQQVSRAGNTLTMDLDSEFCFLATLGQTGPMGRAATQNAFMSVVFEDRFRNAAHETFLRLNIWAFGQRPDRLIINGTALNAGGVVNALTDQGIDVADFDLVRFISCDSVNLAHAFTRQTGSVTTGFRGLMTVRGHTVTAFREMSAAAMLHGDAAGRLFSHQAVLYPERTMAMGVNIFEDHEFFRIMRGFPVSFRIHPDDVTAISRVEGDPLPGWLHSP